MFHRKGKHGVLAVIFATLAIAGIGARAAARNHALQQPTMTPDELVKAKIARALCCSARRGQGRHRRGNEFSRQNDRPASGQQRLHLHARRSHRSRSARHVRRRGLHAVVQGFRRSQAQAHQYCPGNNLHARRSYATKRLRSLRYHQQTHRDWPALDDHVAFRSQNHRPSHHAQTHRSLHHVGRLTLCAPARHGTPLTQTFSLENFESDSRHLSLTFSLGEKQWLTKLY